MRHIRLPIVLTIAMFSVPALPQQIPATSSMEGMVVQGDSGQPIANAQVTLVPGDVTRPDIGAIEVPGQIGPVVTGADGKFLFKDIKAGTYRLVATADGFVVQLYGQKVPFAQGRWLYFRDGQSLRDIVFKLSQAGTVSGRVYDENGQPATGAPVQLLRPTFNAQGGRSYAIAGNAAVDDRGGFRFFGMTPGRYYLGVGILSPAQMGRSVAGMPSGPGLPPRFSTVYYPDSTDLDHASAVEVKGGEETSFNMNVKRQVKAIRVTGRVVDGTGEGIPAGLNIMLGWRTFNSSGSTVVARSIDAATGNFELQKYPPG